MIRAHSSSFRDPSGFVFVREGEILRQVNQLYAPHYDRLMSSGLYRSLVEKSLLIAHEEIDLTRALTSEAHRLLKPQRVPFVSYPYEWGFSQLKEAALNTLAVQRAAMEHEMTLKDASAYNVQFLGTRAVFIDSLSFESYQEGQPWVAYRQFCQHFLAPLMLMSHRDAHLGRLLALHLDGFPLDLASRLLPWRSRLNLGALTHIHLHARSQSHFSQQNKARSAGPGKISRNGLIGILENLEGTVRGLRAKTSASSVWKDYYRDHNYGEAGLAEKTRLVGELVEAVPAAGQVWDLGANTGAFSRLTAQRGLATVAFDLDPVCAEIGWLEASKADLPVLPLVMDLTNPSPSLGWAHQERLSLADRGPADLALALALIHHLRITGNIPLRLVSEFFARICRFMILEFVPRGDSQVDRLLRGREDIFSDYTEAGLLESLDGLFEVLRTEPVPGTQRTLRLLRRV